MPSRKRQREEFKNERPLKRLCLDTAYLFIQNIYPVFSVISNYFNFQDIGRFLCVSDEIEEVFRQYSVRRRLF